MFYQLEEFYLEMKYNSLTRSMEDTNIIQPQFKNNTMIFK